MSIVLENVISGYDTFRLASVSLEITEGSLTVLIGPNGCGKSTLFKTISGQLKPSNGNLSIAGSDMSRLRTRAVAKFVSVLPQHPIVPPGISVEQLVGYGRAPHQNMFGIRTAKDQESIETALETVSMIDRRDHLVSDLSGGQRQRVFVAMCLAQDTPYVLFDEPTSFLDIRYQYEVLDLMADLNNAGKTIVAVLHDLAQAARYASQLIVMKGGRIHAVGKPDDVIDETMVYDVYGIKTKLFADPISGTALISPVK
ncbi:MAG: ATP-binding cassette domain-containing protein [Roseobacter sp.]